MLGGRVVCSGRIILCYHGILPGQRERFKRQIQTISKRKLQNIELTFDDAFENLLDNALPELKRNGVRCTIFAVPGNWGQTPRWTIAPQHPEYNEKLMTAEQLSGISWDLIKIGSHTQTHPDLSKLPPEQVRWELIESKKNLEQMLDKAVEDLALPHGAYNREVLRIAQEAGYKRIYTLEPKFAENQQVGVMGRFSMSPDVWLIEFYLTCAGAYSWLDSWRQFISAIKRYLHK